MQPATPLRRLAALFYDALLLAGALFLAAALALPLNGGAAVEPGNLWMTGWLALVAALFFLWPWRRGGQTLGLRSWGLRLVDAEGGPVSMRRALLRLSLAALLLAPGGLGLLWMAVERDRKTLYDRLSGTRVVRV